jgi:[ribosomal protein S5]-alanine N-acetyltransferase
MGWNDAFNHFPHLETEKYVLRRLKVTDAQSLYNYFSKEEVTKYYDLETFQSPQQAVELIESLLFRYEAKQQIRWGIALKNQGDIIGTCGLHALEKEHAKAELGYDLHPNYWGNGVMTEVIARIVDFGFKEMKLNRIEALYNPLNHASRRVLEKNGFKIEGLLRNRFHKKGEYIDAAISAIIREDKKENL